MAINNEDSEELMLIIPPRQNRRLFKLSVEVPILVVLFSSALTDGVTYNLLLYRACTVDLKYNTTDCALLRSVNKTEEAKELESKVEAVTTLLLMSVSMISGIMPACLSVFIGPWTDRHGRKPLLVWPLFGQVITSVLVVIFSAIPSLSSWWFVLCVLPFALLGGSSTVTLAVNLVITDLSDEETTSFRLALLQGCCFIGVLIGTVTSSYVYQAVGYVLIFILSTNLYIISLLYIILYVDESLAGAITGTLLSLFDCELLKEMSETCFKKRPRIITTILFLLMSTYGLTMFCIAGVGSIDYLFTREKFQWLLKEYTIFSAVNTVIIVLGMFLGMAFFQSVCNMSDGMLLILSYLSFIAEAITRSLSKKSWQLYLAGTMSILGGLSPPLIRSQITKIIPAEEVGKMYSLMSCIEAILSVFSPILFSTLYYKTLSTFPGAIYVMSGTLYVLGLGFVTIAESILHRFRTIQNSELSPDI